MNIIKQWPVFFLLLAFAIAPFFQGIETDVLALVYILLLIVFVKVFLASYTDFLIPYNSLALCIFLFYIWMALSISWSPSPSISLYMFVWLSIFPLCFIIYSLKQPDDWSYLPIGILCVTLIFALVGIYQVFIFKIVSSSFFLEKNTYAGMLNLIVHPTTAWFIISMNKRKKSLSIFLCIALFILFFAFFQTGSRGSTISLFFGLFFIVLINLNYIENFSFFKVAIIVLIAFLFANIQNEGLSVNRLVDLYTGENPNPILQRQLVWRSAWEIIKTAPIMGTGIGTFFIVSPPYRNANDYTSGFFVHNDFLQFWLETGFVGLTLMVLIMFAAIKLFILVLKHRGLKPQDRLEITGLMAGLSAVVIHTFVDFNLYIIAVLMIMGLMCARIQEIFGYYSHGLIKVLIPAHKLSIKVFVSFSLVLPLIMLSYSIPVAIADFYQLKAKKQIQGGEIEKAEHALEKAVLWNSGNIPARIRQFSIYRNILRINKSNAPISERIALYTKAIFVLNKIESLNTYAGIVPESKGHLLIENPDIAVDNWQEKAVHEFKKALHLQPRRYGSRIALARLLEQQGELNEAVFLMNDGVNYYYQNDLPGLDKFYQYAIELNLMNGDTIKAQEIQIEKGLLLGKQ